MPFKKRIWGNKHTWRVWGFDVWGNAKDGYEVNDRHELIKALPLPDNPSDAQIVSALIEQKILKPTVTAAKVRVDGEPDNLYVEDASDGYPLVQLEMNERENPPSYKPLMVALRRENKGIKDDPQFSPYMPSYRYIVFHDYGHPTHLGDKTFRTRAEAETWITQQKNKKNPPLYEGSEHKYSLWTMLTLERLSKEADEPTASSAREILKAIRGSKPVLGGYGHFLTAVLKGDEDGAWYRADLSNQRILKKIGTHHNPLTRKEAARIFRAAKHEQRLGSRFAPSPFRSRQAGIATGLAMAVTPFVEHKSYLQAKRIADKLHSKSARMLGNPIDVLLKQWLWYDADTRRIKTEADRRWYEGTLDKLMERYDLDSGNPDLGKTLKALFNMQTKAQKNPWKKGQLMHGTVSIGGRPARYTQEYLGGGKWSRSGRFIGPRRAWGTKRFNPLTPHERRLIEREAAAHERDSREHRTCKLRTFDAGTAAGMREAAAIAEGRERMKGGKAESRSRRNPRVVWKYIIEMKGPYGSEDFVYYSERERQAGLARLKKKVLQKYGRSDQHEFNFHDEPLQENPRRNPVLAKLPADFGAKHYAIIEQSRGKLPSYFAGTETQYLEQDGDKLIRWVTRYEGRDSWNKLIFKRKEDLYKRRRNPLRGGGHNYIFLKKGTRVHVTARHTAPGKGLSHPAFDGRLLEDARTGTWDVFDVLNDKGETVSVYGFSLWTGRDNPYEHEHRLRPNIALHNQVLKMLMAKSYDRNALYQLDMVRRMDPRKLSQSDEDSLKDLLEMHTHKNPTYAFYTRDGFRADSKAHDPQTAYNKLIKTDGKQKYSGSYGQYDRSGLMPTGRHDGRINQNPLTPKEKKFQGDIHSLIARVRAMRAAERKQAVSGIARKSSRREKARRAAFLKTHRR